MSSLFPAAPTNDVGPAPAGASLADLLARNARTVGGALALVEKRRGRYETVSWSAAEREVSALALSLAELGFRPGSVLVTLAGLSREWLFISLAAQRLGGTVAALSRHASDAALDKALASPDAGFVFAFGAREVRRVVALDATRSSRLVLVVARTQGLEIVTGGASSALAALSARGHELSMAEVALTSPKKTGAPAFVPFTEQTPGLSGPSAEAGTFAKDLIEEALRRASPLQPSSRLWLDAPEFGGAFLTGLAYWLLSGALLGIPESADTRGLDRRAFEPTHLFAAQSWAEDLQRDLDARLPFASSLTGRLVARSLKGPERSGIAALQKIAAWLVLEPVRRKLGLARLELALLHGDLPGVRPTSLLAALGVPWRAWDAVGARGVALVERSRPASEALAMIEREGSRT